MSNAEEEDRRTTKWLFKEFDPMFSDKLSAADLFVRSMIAISRSLQRAAALQQTLSPRAERADIIQSLVLQAVEGCERLHHEAPLSYDIDTEH